jgi:hypothetical protein
LLHYLGGNENTTKMSKTAMKVCNNNKNVQPTETISKTSNPREQYQKHPTHRKNRKQYQKDLTHGKRRKQTIECKCW